MLKIREMCDRLNVNRLPIDIAPDHKGLMTQGAFKAGILTGRSVSRDGVIITKDCEFVWLRP